MLGKKLGPTVVLGGGLGGTGDGFGGGEFVGGGGADVFVECGGLAGFEVYIPGLADGGVICSDVWSAGCSPGGSICEGIGGYARDYMASDIGKPIGMNRGVDGSICVHSFGIEIRSNGTSTIKQIRNSTTDICGRSNACFNSNHIRPHPAENYSV